MEKKCRRVGKWRPRLCDADTTDRLSYLPDFVLYHILSFVDTKTVVQTSVLSRRWRCVWKHVPALVFDSLSFDHHSKRFNTFVDKVLSLRYPTNVDKISYFNTLFYEIDEDEEEEDDRALKEDDDLLVVKIVEYAVSHETQHLALGKIYYDEEEFYKFPQSFHSFSNCNLKSLKFNNFVIDDRFSSFGFRLLTTLELDYCLFESNLRQCVDPFSKFPCLKNLSIIDEKFCGEATRLRIAGLQLHSLKLEYVDLANVEICAPNLKSFIFLECLTWLRFSELVLVLPSLDHAFIDHEDIPDRNDFTKENLVLLLQAFHNVKSLTLGRRVVEVICLFQLVHSVKFFIPSCTCILTFSSCFCYV
ncbi:Putative F-box/LRR-repeat protein At3g18150 [Linum perenne]